VFNLIKRNTLASQLLIKVFSLYFIIAIFVTLVHMYWQYHDTKSYISKEISDTHTMIASSLSKALWDYDDEQIIHTLKGLELLPYIHSVYLFEQTGTTYTSTKKLINTHSNKLVINHKNNIIQHSAELYHLLNYQQKSVSQKEVIGKLIIYGDNNELYQRLKVGFSLLILNALIKTLALWIIFIAIAQVMLQRPLERIIKATQEFNVNTPKPMEIDLQVYQQNELKILEESMNRMSARLYHDNALIKQQTSTIEHQGTHDHLTDLPNRVLCGDRISQSIKFSYQNSLKTAVLFIDLDRFKEINDSQGHRIGDKVLNIIADRLKMCTGQSDTLGRIGGDEFVILLNAIEEKEVIDHILNLILKSIAEVIELNNKKFYVTCSIGVSVFPDDGESTEVLLRNAHSAMNLSKDEGRNTYRFYKTEMTDKAVKHILLENNLRHALDNQELTLYYQPQVNAITNEIIGMEALVRWIHPQQGIISPADFIPLAEYTGLIIPLGEYVLSESCRQIALWKKQFNFSGRVSINFSVKQLMLANINSIIRETIQKNDCQAEWLEIEVTEGYIMKNFNIAIKTLSEIKASGITISIDDFGTGYSSLAYLKRLPVDKLKIDQSFVRDLTSDPDDQTIVESIISLAKNMNLDIIAEGVETEEQKNFLKKNGCTNIQGYFYGKPMPANEMEKFLSK